MKQEKRKLEMTITSCEMCPFAHLHEDYENYDGECNHFYNNYMNDVKIYNSEQIKEDCPLTKIEE